jgi:AAA domain, putative AbiEii toxin, Type IV TA system
MRLVSIDYANHEGEPREWRLDGVVLESINLVVGRNATGKTRMLDSIAFLAKLLCGKERVSFPVRLNAKFEHEGSGIDYGIVVSKRGVESESFDRGGKRFLNRGAEGRGTIWAEKTKDDIEFQTPITDIAAFVRRDSLQHPFLEPLTKWAEALRHYHFGDHFGKPILAVMSKSPVPEFDTTNEYYTSALFSLGTRFGPDFKQSVIADMVYIGYPIEDVDLIRPVSQILPPHPVGDYVTLAAKETGLETLIDQKDMSQGMYRALSIIIHVNFALKSGTPSCLLIDDIGEGLDFGRSCSIIELLRNKIESSPVQLIMSTNDRFVMNKVPIKHWTYLYREGNVTKAYNYANSKKKFDKFKFTGLNNFDFFATDYIHGVTKA